MPQTVLGMSMFVLVGALGAAFSGAVLYAYYDYRLNQYEEQTAAFAAEFDERFAQARQLLQAERDDAKAQIRQELEPLKKIAAEGETLTNLAERVGPSVWFVESQDEAGQPSVGSAFVVASDSDESYLVTSYTTVRAATRQPGPAIVLRKGGDTVDRVTLWTWQEERDLALLIVPRGNLPKLAFAPGATKTKIGERLFGVSGLGAGNGAVTQGFVADVSETTVQHDVPVGASFQGGPLVNSNGEVVAVASRAYAPLGFASDEVFFGIPVQVTCERVLRCPSGGAAQPGER